MNILHAIFSTEFAGSERYACQLAGMQAMAGHKVLLLVKGASPAMLARLVAEAAPAQVAHVPTWWPSVLDGFAIRGVANGFVPQVFHTHLGRATKRVAKVAKRMKVPHVASLHLRYQPPYAACDGLICVAEWQRQEIPAGYTGKVATVWNWVPPVKGRRKPATTGAKGEVVFGSVGRLVPNKGMDVLVRAFRQAFPKGNEKVALEIAGAGAQQAELERLAAGDGRIRLLDYVPEVEGLYARWHAYVSAARYEPFGLTILEAMRAGCRLVCTQTQGPSEFLADYAVEWAKLDDVDSLAKALRRAAKQPAARVPWDMSPFAPEAALDKVMALYRQLV